MKRVTFFNPERYLERLTQFTNTDGREVENFFRSFEDACYVHKTKSDGFTSIGHVNGTFRHSVTIRRTNDAAGFCNGASFTFRGTSYDKCVLEQDIEITLFSQTAKVDVQSNQIILPGGASCNYKALGCQDDFTEFFWIPREIQNDCVKTRFSYLVHGDIEMVTATSNHSKSPVRYAVVEIDKLVFALKLLTPATICHLNGYMTEHSNLFFVETPSGYITPFLKLLLKLIWNCM